MIVFVIEKGCRYEGGSVVGLAKTWVGAQRIVDRLIAEHNVEEQDRNAYWDEQNLLRPEGEEPDHYEVQVYKRQPGPKACWLTDFDVISITEMSVEE